MEERLKQRLVGAIVLVSLAVVFVPILFDMPREVNEDISTIPITEIPERPQDRFGSSVSITLDLPETPRLDAEVERERNRNASSADADDRRTSSGALAAASTSAAPEAPASATSESSVSGSTSTSSGDVASTPAPGPSESPAPVSRPESSPARSNSESTANKSDDAPARKQAAEAPAAGGWIVQLGSFLISENAIALRKRLRAKGYPAFVESGSSAQGTVSRVFVGPMPDREQAKDSAAKLRREMALKGIVVAYPGG